MPPAEGEADFESDSDDGATLSAFEDVLQGWAKAVQLAEWAEGPCGDTEGGAGTGTLHSSGAEPVTSPDPAPALSQVGTAYSPKTKHLGVR